MNETYIRTHGLYEVPAEDGGTDLMWRHPYFGCSVSVASNCGPINNPMICPDLLDVLAKHLRKRIRNGRQNVVLVSGATGSGKSTCAIDLARMMDRSWKLDEGYVYTQEDLFSRLDSCEQSVLVFDEGSVILNSKNALTRGNRDILLFFDTMRSRGITALICIPNILSLDKGIRDFHADFLLQMPSRSPLRGYNVRGFVGIYKHRLRDFGQPYWQPLGYGLFDDLKPSLKAEYATIKRQRQDALLSEMKARHGFAAASPEDEGEDLDDLRRSIRRI